MLARKIRPVYLAHDELAVRRLVEQEVRKPLFAARPDEEIRIGNAGRVEIGRDQVVVDAIRAQFAACDVGGDRANGTFELAARTVIHRKVEDQPGIRLGALLQRIERVARAFGQRLPVADDPHAHVFALEFGELALGEIDAQVEKKGDLLGVASPIFRREAVDGYDLDAEFTRRLRDTTQRNDPAAMAFEGG